MSMLLSPAVRLMQQLRLLPKFGLVALLFALPLLLVTALLLVELQQSVASTETRRAGLKRLEAGAEAARLLEQHRAWRHLALAGSKPAAARADEIRAALDTAIARLTTDAAPAAADAGKQWQTLKERIAGLQAKESYALHGALLARIAELNTRIAESSGLTLDPEIAPHHLATLAVTALPELASGLADVAARGAAYIDTGLQEGGEDVLLSSTLMLAQRDLARMPERFAAVLRERPALAARLKPEQASLAGAGLFIERARNEVLSSVDQTSGMAFLEAGLQSIDALHGAARASRAELDALLAQRVEDQTGHRNLIVLIAVAALSAAMWLLSGFIESFRRDIGQLGRAVAKAAQGDLSVHVSTRSRDEIGELATAFDDMIDGLGRLVRQVRGGSETIGRAAAEIASGNADLSARTESQAGALQQTVSSMEELTAAVRRNSTGAADAHRLTLTAGAIADKGGEAVERAVASMAAIKASSAKVIDIIRVIDELAFQTNLLALNAAVEAARAGVHGRGFAVVASEVRALAQRSAGASHEIRKLIDGAVGETERGNAMVADAGKTMRELLGAVREVTLIMQDIADASSEQSTGIEQVNLSIGQMDEVTQRNAALVEQAAQASAALRQQAEDLLHAVAAFRLDEDGEPQAPAAVSAAVRVLPVPGRPLPAVLPAVLPREERPLLRA
ncbi:methyl-accepting chemotaxis protein [Noviherbaspirillum aridicola]|uniref:Methyl-accepting chemotaxis protein n=1 Tax=Noviherbaspirillum aridicola TaxID=2849687 RepID=A0ABQ4QAB3_9BURK|nr:methyl-accepting chemotaxis protein [Noviherbaspirillum aridicola]GIZ54002.1 hypothetical protein NCCP691_40160 [Noviherbaspirillum aridicola]